MDDKKTVEQGRNAKKCWSCGAIFVGHFCTDCGAKAQEEIAFCPVCGADRVKGKAFCGNCGFSYGDTGDYVEEPSISTVGIPTFTPQEGTATSETEGNEVSQVVPQAPSQAQPTPKTSQETPKQAAPSKPKQAAPNKPAGKNPAASEGQNKGWASFLSWLQSHKVLAICAVAFVVVAAVALGLIIGLSGTDDQSSQGFSYEEMIDGTITITGMGTCTDTKLIIPETINGYTVTDIDFKAFQGCTELTSVTIPKSVARIGNWAFYDCTGLTSVTFGDSVTSIGDSAFACCTGLTSVTIPNSVTSIGQQAFYSCTGLTSVTIPNSVASIGSQAFNDCTGLTSVTIPDSVTSIGGSAFNGCTGLTSITIPDSVTSIGYSAFRGCTGLTSVTIPDSVTSIGSYAFEGCTGLTSVTIPDSVTSIGERAFRGCTNLTTIYCEAASKPSGWSSDWKAGCVAQVIWGASLDLAYTVNSDGTTCTITGMGTCSDTDLVIPKQLDGYIVTSIGERVFRGCTGLTSVTIPDSVTSIGDFAFYGCTGLTSVHISDLRAWCEIELDSTDANPLYYAKHLYLNGNEVAGDLVIPEGTTKIGSYAFRSCTGLTSVTIPDSVTSIGWGAFYDCTNLTTIYCEAASQPSGWSSYWKGDCTAQVVWGHKDS